MITMQSTRGPLAKSPRVGLGPIQPRSAGTACFCSHRPCFALVPVLPTRGWWVGGWQARARLLQTNMCQPLSLSLLLLHSPPKKAVFACVCSSTILPPFHSTRRSSTTLILPYCSRVIQYDFPTRTCGSARLAQPSTHTLSTTSKMRPSALFAPFFLAATALGQAVEEGIAPNSPPPEGCETTVDTPFMIGTLENPSLNKRETAQQVCIRAQSWLWLALHYYPIIY